MPTVLYSWACTHSSDHILRIRSTLPPSTQPFLLTDRLILYFVLPCTDFTNKPGLRDGFMEFVNIEEQVKSYIKESISTCDSSPICSQVWFSKNLCYELIYCTISANHINQLLPKLSGVK